MASNAENVSIWWCHHEIVNPLSFRSTTKCVQIESWKGLRVSMYFLSVMAIIRDPPYRWHDKISCSERQQKINFFIFSEMEINMTLHIQSDIVFRVYCQCSLQWRHNGRDSVSNHQPYDCLLNRLFRRRSKKTSNLCVTGLCAGNSPGTGEFHAQMASNAENVSIWWRHHVCRGTLLKKRIFVLNRSKSLHMPWNRLGFILHPNNFTRIWLFAISYWFIVFNYHICSHLTLWHWHSRLCHGVRELSQHWFGYWLVARDVDLLPTLKKSSWCNFFFINGGTGGCHDDNLRC